MKRILVCLMAALLIAPLATPQEVIVALRHKITASGGATGVVFNAACGSGTSLTVNTTGATAVAVIMAWYYTSSTPATVTDTLNSAPTAFAAVGNANNAYMRMFYWTTPVTGSDTFTNAGVSYQTMCVIPMKGITGAYDASSFQSLASASSSTTCQTPATNPGAGNHLVIAAATNGGTATFSVDSSYTLDGSVAGVSGSYDGIAAGHLAQNPGASTDPTWTFSGSVGNSCLIASFN